MGRSRPVEQILVGLGLCLLLSGILAGCNQEIDQSQEKREVFRGRLILEKDPWVVGQTDTDQIEFLIQGGTYALQFLTFDTRLCDSKGRAYGFGTSQVNFTPTTIFVGNCDSLHVPRGYFQSAFKGDSLYLNKFDTARNLRYQLDLTK